MLFIVIAFGVVFCLSTFVLHCSVATEFVVTPGRSWMLQTGRMYYIHVEIFDKESRRIYPSEVCYDFSSCTTCIGNIVTTVLVSLLLVVLFVYSPKCPAIFLAVLKYAVI